MAIYKIREEELINKITDQLETYRFFNNDETKFDFTQITDLIDNFDSVNEFHLSDEFGKCRRDYIHFMDTYIFDGCLHIKDITSLHEIIHLFANDDNIIFDESRSLSHRNGIIGAYIIWKLLFYSETSNIVCLNQHDSEIMFNELSYLINYINDTLLDEYKAKIVINMDEHTISYNGASCYINDRHSFERQYQNRYWHINNLIFQRKYFIDIFRHIVETNNNLRIIQ